ncbi:MAG TPA: MFS transporter [Solirubrobacteraceae bacterium]|nr:MFS transporter [Solirubrobacteraceae bacterium]
MAATVTRPPGFITALRASGAAAPFVASLIGRLPMGAVGLVFILRTKEITGSFAVGGLATGAYALSIGVIAPAMGRLIDVKGQTRVLLGTGVVYASALIGFAALPGDASVALIVALAALTGASQPPLGATVRSLWSQTLDDPATRHVLFTGESAVLEAIYISGPVLIVAGIGGLISIPAAALACGIFGLLGTVMFAATAASRAWRPAPDRVGGLAGALASPGVRTLLATLTVVGAAAGMIEVAVPALCERAGTPSATGFVLGLWGLGSLVGGFVASRLAAAENPGRRVIVLLAAMAAGTAPLVLASGVVSLGALMFVAGIAIAPALAAVHSLTGQLAVRGTVTEAYTWLGTGMGSGIAIGATLGGAVVEGAGTGEAFLLSAAAVGLAAVLAGARRGSLQPA